MKIVACKYLPKYIFFFSSIFLFLFTGYLMEFDMILEIWQMLVIIFIPFAIMVLIFYWFKIEIENLTENFDKKISDQKKDIEFLKFNIEQLQSSKKKTKLED